MGIRALTREISQYVSTLEMVKQQEAGSKNGRNEMLKQEGRDITG